MPTGTDVGDDCGKLDDASTFSAVRAGGSSTFSPTEATFDPDGTIKYDLEVYDADSFAGLTVLIFIVLLLVMFIGSLGGGGFMAYKSARNM